MRKWIVIFAVLVMASGAHAATTTIGALVADTAPGSTDVIEIEQSDASASNKVTLGNAITKAHGLGSGTGPVVMGASGVLATIADPNADKILGWDDSATAMAYFGLGTGLAFSATPTIDLDATISALAGLTIADVSIIEGTGADAYAVVTSGGANRYLKSKSDNSALEFAVPTLAEFTSQTAWRVFYSDGSGDVKELALGSSGTYLKSNGADQAPSFDTPSGAAHDAVSLAADAAGILSLSTQELTLDTQTANYVWAGPTSGAAADPTFRALVAADLPTNTKAIEGLTLADVSIIEGTGSGAVAVVASGGANRILGSNSDNSALEFKSTLTGLTFDLGTPSVGAGEIVTVDANGVMQMSTTVLGTMAGATATDYVAKALYDAHSVLYATTDNTPAALTVGEQTVVGRATGGNIAAIAIDSDLSSVSANDDTVPSAKATKAVTDLKAPSAVSRTEFIPVAWMIDGAAAPAALATTDLGTRQVKTRAFQGDTADQDLEMFWQAPDDIADGAAGAGFQVKWRPIFVITSATAPAAGEGVAFALQACSSGNGDTGDCTVGTAAVIADADLDAHVQFDIVYGGWTEMTVTDGAASEGWFMKLYRDQDNAIDDYAQPVGLVGIELKYKATLADNY